MKDRAFVDVDHHQGDDASLYANTNPTPINHETDYIGSSGGDVPYVPVSVSGPGANPDNRHLVHTQVFQQSVTLTASMWPADNATQSTSPWGLLWRVSSERLPLLVGVFCGGALVVFVLFTLIVYRCCIMPRREKQYCMRKGEPDPRAPAATSQPTPGLYPSHSAIFADPKSGQLTYSSRLVMSPAPPPNSNSVPSVSGAARQHWFYNNRIVGAGLQCTQCPGTCPVVPRSSSNPGPPSAAAVHHQQIPMQNNTQRRQRPMSQPIRFGPCDLVTNGETTPKKAPMPEISEFSPQAVQYASSSILDEVGTKEDDENDASGSTNLKTRSLPAWVRSKPRPLSTEDDLNDLYAKVNFSKKRKNRMRNDEAAIIALSKSRSQFLHKDTDSLVDNEAVIVYDERTAL